MKSITKNGRTQEEKRDKREAYEAPAIIFETLITTRAGSPLGGPLGDGDAGADGVDPADLFKD